MRKTMKISCVAVLTTIVLMGLMVSVSPAQMIGQIVPDGGKQLGYNPNLCAGCGGNLHGGYCNSCEVYCEPFADCGTGDCSVRSTDCGIGSAVRDVVHVALTPVYWVASLLSMGTYADCGCAAPVRQAYCDPCDQCANWVGCDSCGGVGCNSCGSATGSFSGGMTTMGAASYGNTGQGEVIYYDNPNPTQYQQVPENGAPPKIIDTETSNPPQSYYRPNPPRPNQQNRNVSQQNFNGFNGNNRPMTQGAMNSRPSAPPVMMPPQKVAMGAPVNVNNRPAPMVNAEQMTNSVTQTPQFIFVTPNGDVIPPEKVKGFNGQTDETTFEIAPLAMPMPQPIRPVSYEKPKAGPLDFLAKRPNTAAQPTGNAPRYGK